MSYLLNKWNNITKKKHGSNFIIKKNKGRSEQFNEKECGKTMNKKKAKCI